jgi:hypothetical protein
MHNTFIKKIDKYRKHCLWRGADINAKSPPKAAWEMVCLPKSEGGLGVSPIMKPYYSRIYTNFSIRQIPHGYTWSGRTIIQMASFPIIL